LTACVDDGADIDLLGGSTHADAVGDSHLDARSSSDAGVTRDMLSDGAVAHERMVGEPVLYSLGIELVELGGFLLSLQLDTVPILESGERVAFERLSLRAVKDGLVSEIFAEVSDVDILDDARFVADFAESTLPAAFSPTGSDVEFELRFEGRIRMDGTLCGVVTGEITTLEQELTMSTFGTRVWDESGSQPPGGCMDTELMENCPRLIAEDCPDVLAGFNTLQSCGLERRFKLILPETESDTALPIIFMWHGLTSNPDRLLELNQLALEVPMRNFILVAPESRGLPVEWEQLTTGDNPDLAFFDDLHTCMSTRFNLDAERVYSAGLSAGAMWTSYLALMRPEIFAAVAPMSGGLIMDYFVPSRAVPFLVSWGGSDDMSNGQNFETFAQDLIMELRGGEHPVVTCNHGEGHAWNPPFNPWVLDYLFAHTLSGNERPFEDGLSAVFPDYCVRQSP